MKNVALLFATALLFVATDISLRAQSTGDPDKVRPVPTVASSNAEGTRFLLGFMKNEESTSLPSMILGRGSSNQKIVITSRYTTMVTVQLPGGGGITRLLSPLGVETIYLNGEQYECLSELCDNTIEITSEKPINVYGFSAKVQTSDGYLALPVSSWGSEYVTANYYLDYYEIRGLDPWEDSTLVEPRGGEFAIIAAEDSTLVTVTPKVETREGYLPGVPVQKMLHTGEMWQLEDGGQIRMGSDITGSYITADKPVGVLSGHVRTGIPTVFQTKDHLIEMLSPIEDLGSRHILVPFGGRRGGDIARIIAAHPGQTTVTLSTSTGQLNHFLNGIGSFVEIDVTDVTVVETSQDVLVAHYSQSSGVDPLSSFDPYMIVTTPEAQFSYSAVFQTMADFSGSSGAPRKFNSHFVTIVAEKEGFESLTLNGRPIAFLPYVGRGPVPTLEDEYVWVTLRINQDAAYVIEGQAQFGGYVYGIGQFDSYGWPVGTGDTPVLIDTIPPKLYAEPECGTLFWTITATDSTSGTDSTSEDKGVLYLELDLNTAENVRILERDPDLPSAGPIDVATMRLTLADPTKPGRASIIAIDAGGALPTIPRNRDTIEVELKVNPPDFSRDSVLIVGARVNVAFGESIEVTSLNGDTIRIDSLRLVKGDAFTIDGMGSGGMLDELLGAEDTLRFGLTFLTGTTGFYTDTLVVWVDCLPYRIPLTAFMKVPAIIVSDLDFGAIRKGTDSCAQMEVRNGGGETLIIENIRINQNPSGIFTFDASNTPDLPITLEPGESVWIDLCFHPEEVLAYTGTATFTSNATSGDSVGSLTGRAIAPDLQIGDHHFGPVQIGDTKCDSVPITNPGTIPILLTDVTIVENVFVADKSIFPHELQPGDTLWVRVCFTPTEEDPVESLIGADNAEELERDGRLTGSGFHLMAEIDGYDWGERWVNTSHDTIVHVRNLTDREIEVDSIWLAGGDDGDFTLLTQIPPAITLGPNEEYPLDVRFSPLVVGKRSIGIYARTNSRRTPVIDNLLEGFGLQPIPADELVHDTTTIFSCDEQRSYILLYNRGNTALTLEEVTIEWPGGTPDPRVRVNDPAAGARIPVGDTPLEIEVIHTPDGVAGPATVTVGWGFRELSGDRFVRTLTFNSSVQQFEITAAAPPQIDNAQEFELFVTLDEGTWPERLHSEVVLDISYNPTVSYFDRELFTKLSGTPTTDWVFVGTPEFFDSTTVRLRLRPAAGFPLTLSGRTLPGIPFRGYFGPVDLDTFDVAMTVDDGACVLPASTFLPYSITNICGLDARLFNIFGDPPSLSQGKPNPARNQTAINFTLPFEGQVDLELYSVDGELVSTLVSEVRGPGNYSVTVDLEKISSGVYYYRMTHSTYVATRTLVVQK